MPQRWGLQRGTEAREEIRAGEDTWERKRAWRSAPIRDTSTQRWIRVLASIQDPIWSPSGDSEHLVGAQLRRSSC